MFTMYFVSCNTDIDRYYYVTNTEPNYREWENVEHFQIDNLRDILNALDHISRDEIFQEQDSEDSVFDMEGLGVIFHTWKNYK
jgi:hypothetical protein